MARQKPCTFTLQTEDGTKFEVDKNLAAQSETIMKLVVEGGHDNDNDGILHVPNVTGPTLDKVIKLWKLQRMNMSRRLMSSYAMFAKAEEVMELVIAVNYLDCKELIDVTRMMVKEIAPDDAASYFNLRVISPDDMD